MTDSLAKPANLPEPHYTPEKGGWKVWGGGEPPSDASNKVLFRSGRRFTGKTWTADWRKDATGSAHIIAYLAKPACICKTTGKMRWTDALCPVHVPTCNPIESCVSGWEDSAPMTTTNPERAAVVALVTLEADFTALHEAMMIARNGTERWREGGPHPDWSYWDGRAESYNEAAIKVAAIVRHITEQETGNGRD